MKYLFVNSKLKRKMDGLMSVTSMVQFTSKLVRKIFINATTFFYFLFVFKLVVLLLFRFVFNFLFVAV